MVPTITAQGTSFHGAFLYYFHDKGERSRNRIGFTQTLNMLTESVDKAWKVMAYTAKYASHLKEASGQKPTGAKLKKAVFAYSLSWHPEQSPSSDEMLDAARESLEALGLGEHEAMIAEHTDEPHPHLHIVVNKVHPLTGLVAKLKYTKEKLSNFALKQERKEGKVYCSKREENHAKRENGQKTKYSNSQIAGAWQDSHSGASFKSNLEAKGYHLAQGDKCIVIVDSKGKPQNAARAVGLKKKEFEARLGEETISGLPHFDAVKQKLKDTEAKTKLAAPAKEPVNTEKVEWIERKANAMNALALKQFDEISALSSKHERRIENTRSELERFHDVGKLEKNISTLEAKLQKSNFIHKVIGLHRHRENKLAELNMGLSNTKERLSEAIQPMVKRKFAELEDLRNAHVEQRKALEVSFEQWVPQDSAIEDLKPRNPSGLVVLNEKGFDLDR